MAGRQNKTSRKVRMSTYEQQEFIDALREVLGLSPLYHKLDDVPRPERFFDALPKETPRIRPKSSQE